MLVQYITKQRPSSDVRSHPRKKKKKQESDKAQPPERQPKGHPEYADLFSNSSHPTTYSSIRILTRPLPLPTVTIPGTKLVILVMHVYLFLWSEHRKTGDDLWCWGGTKVVRVRR